MRKLILTAPDELRDALSGALFEAGALGVQEDGQLLVVYAEDERVEATLRSAVARFEQLARALDPSVEVLIRAQEVEQTWHSAWLGALEPAIVVSPWVVRPTTRAPAPGDESTLWYEPSATFGDGSHPTTQLAASALLDALAAFPLQLVPRLLDVGAGNGVLSMIACAEAARCDRPIPRVVAIDTDAVAVDSMKKNWALNNLPTADLRLGSIGDVCGDHDLVVANITADVLADLLEPLTEAVAPAGTLILAGLLESDERSLTDGLARAGFHVRRRASESDWVVLSSERVP